VKAPDVCIDERKERAHSLQASIDEGTFFRQSTRWASGGGPTIATSQRAASAGQVSPKVAPHLLGRELPLTVDPVLYDGYLSVKEPYHICRTSLSCNRSLCTGDAVGKVAHTLLAACREPEARGLRPNQFSLGATDSGQLLIIDTALTAAGGAVRLFPLVPSSCPLGATE
jgi:hypothetical protein